MNSSTNVASEPAFSLQACLLAFLWPGLGHISLGERNRGILIMFGVLFLYFSGLLIGGVDVVDRRSDRLWFYAQAVCGPIAFATDWVTQSCVKQVPDEELSERLRQGDPAARATILRTSLGKVNEIGTLFCALAGLMNLIVILDALHFNRPGPVPVRDRPSGGQGAGG